MCFGTVAAKTFYAKVIVKSEKSDYGLVAVSQDSNNPGEYAAEREASGSKNNWSLISGDVDFYIFARPSDGYVLTAWKKDGNIISTDCNIKRTIKSKNSDSNNPATETLVACFEPRFVTVASQGEGSATISSVSNITGDKITVTATPSASTATKVSKFAGWYKDDVKVSDQLSYQIDVDDIYTLTARFVSVSVNAQGFGSASLSTEGAPVAVPVKLAALSQPMRTGNYVNTGETNRAIKFAGWFDGDVKVADNENFDYTATKDVTLTARFELEATQITGNGYYRIRGPFGAPLTVTGNWQKTVPTIANLLSGAKTANMRGSLDWKLCPEGTGEYGHGYNNTYCDPATVIYVTGSKTSDYGDGYANNRGILDDVSFISQGVNTYDLFKDGLIKYHFKIKWTSDPGYQKIRYCNDASGELTFDVDNGSPVDNKGIVRMVTRQNDAPAEMRVYFEPVNEANLNRYWFGACPDPSFSYGNAYWTTMYASFPYQCLDGVEAYIIREVTIKDAPDKAPLGNLVGISSGIVPAGTPVLLKCPVAQDVQDYMTNGTAPEAINRLLPLDPNDSRINPAEVEGNLLRGAYQVNNAQPSSSNLHPGHTELSDNLGLLSIDAYGDVCFMHPASTRAADTQYIPTNGVYMDLSNYERPIYIYDGKNTTGVENIIVDSDNAHKQIYDIYGRRVSRMVRGNIYIVDGKKVRF